MSKLVKKFQNGGNNNASYWIQRQTIDNGRGVGPTTEETIYRNGNPFMKRVIGQIAPRGINNNMYGKWTDTVVYTNPNPQGSFQRSANYTNGEESLQLAYPIFQKNNRWFERVASQAQPILPKLDKTDKNQY